MVMVGARSGYKKKRILDEFLYTKSAQQNNKIIVA
jgi:hypothetical protein